MSKIDENMVEEIRTDVEIEETEDQKDTSKIMDIAVVGGLMGAGVLAWKAGGYVYRKAIQPGIQWIKGKFNKGENPNVEVPDEEGSKKTADGKKSEAKKSDK